MLFLIAISLLLVGFVVIVAARLWRPNLAIGWLVASLSVWLAWLSILLAPPLVPQMIHLGTWEPQDLFSASPALLIDQISWYFAIALVTIALSTLLAGVIQLTAPGGTPPRWSSWATILAMTAFSLVTVLSANLLTLTLAWGGMDLLEFLLWWSQEKAGKQNERAVIALSARFAGLMLVILAGIVAGKNSLPLSMTDMDPRVGFYLFLAAGIRLGVLPLNTPLVTEHLDNPSLESLLRLAPAATNLALLTRLAVVGAPHSLATVLLIPASLSAFYGCLSWMNAQDETDGLPYWLIGAASLATASALLADQAACLAWSLALLFYGNMVSLYTIHLKRLVPLFAIGALGFSALPFTPAWAAAGLYARLNLWFIPLFIFSQAFLLVGFIRHALRPTPVTPRSERWVWVLYPWGLIMPPLAHLLIYWTSKGTLYEHPAWVATLLSALALALAFPIYFWGMALFWETGKRRRLSLHGRFTLHTLLSLEWVYTLFWRAYRPLSRLADFTNRVLEGPAGILWALLILILLISLVTPARLGG